MARRPVHITLVATYPADSFDMADGTLAHHIAQGNQVTVVIATTGVRSHHWQVMEQKRLKGQNFDVAKHVEQSVEEKLKEVRGACRILGFDDVRDLGFEDDDILLNQEKIDAIADMIRQAKPDILIAHDPYESGGLKMHNTISQATIRLANRGR